MKVPSLQTLAVEVIGARLSASQTEKSYLWVGNDYRIIERNEKFLQTGNGTNYCSHMSPQKAAIHPLFWHTNYEEKLSGLPLPYRVTDLIRTEGKHRNFLKTFEEFQKRLIHYGISRKGATPRKAAFSLIVYPKSEFVYVITDYQETFQIVGICCYNCLYLYRFSVQVALNITLKP